MKDFLSFSIVCTLFSLGAFAIAAAPHTAPDEQGLTECLKLHPSRYCRIANGFPVKPLP